MGRDLVNKDYKMRLLSLLAVLCVFVTAFPDLAHAKSWGWWPQNWRSQSFQPYLGKQTLTQRGLWDRDDWTPEAWIKDAGDVNRIMHDLYATDIIADQYTDGKNIPVLVVGYNFMRLSGTDRRRVLEFIDHVFKITQAHENGMFFVYYREADKKPIGVYDKNGFQQS